MKNVLPDSDLIRTDLAIIGAGMAGSSAALFALNRGIKTVQVGGTGELVYASGLLDLLGTHPIEAQKTWMDPWEGIESLVRDIPNHPYARLAREDIEAAFDEVLTFLQGGGLAYRRNADLNCDLVTSAGTLKRTYCVPETMWQGVQAWKKKTPCLLVDFEGMKDYSARQIAATLHDAWPELQALRISFPGTRHLPEVTPEYVARQLELPEKRKALVWTLSPHLEQVRAVGFPAVLGFTRSAEVVADLKSQFGKPVFEIPTSPVSVPGLRVKNVFEEHLPRKGLRFLHDHVVEEKNEIDGCFLLSVGDDSLKYSIRARGVILASGRFLGGGLAADRHRIRETLFDLPVHQPEDRSGWHHRELLDPRGHPINRAGLEVDNLFRPLDSSGHPAARNLFAVGSILAHQDWIRMKCGSGLAIASAYAAVNAFAKSTKASL